MSLILTMGPESQEGLKQLLATRLLRRQKAPESQEGLKQMETLPSPHPAVSDRAPKSQEGLKLIVACPGKVR